MRSIRARLERLEQRLRLTPGGINWDNLWKRREDIVPDGIIDWEAMFRPWEPWSAENCPIERAIAEVARSASERKASEVKDSE
jgi:hypothetical protein